MLSKTWTSLKRKSTKYYDNNKPRARDTRYQNFTDDEQEPDEYEDHIFPEKQEKKL